MFSWLYQLSLIYTTYCRICILDSKMKGVHSLPASGCRVLALFTVIRFKMTLYQATVCGCLHRNSYLIINLFVYK